MQPSDAGRAAGREGVLLKTTSPMETTNTPQGQPGNDRLYLTKEAAPYLRVSHRTMEDWRLKGGGPRFSYAGRRIVYRQSELDGFLAARTFGNTGEAKMALRQLHESLSVSAVEAMVS